MKKMKRITRVAAALGLTLGEVHLVPTLYAFGAIYRKDLVTTGHLEDEMSL
jgi:hypothetical protein